MINLLKETYRSLSPVTRFIAVCGVAVLTVMLSLLFILSGAAGVYTEYHNAIYIRDQLAESMKITFGLFLISSLGSEFVIKK